MAFKRLEYCGQHVTTGTVSGFSTTTPANEGTEHWVLDSNSNALERYVWTKDSNGAASWLAVTFTTGLDANNTAINYVTTASSSATNRNSIVINPSGNKWIIDAKGNATPAFGTIRYNSTIGRGEMYVNDENGDGTQGDAGWRAL